MKVTDKEIILNYIGGDKEAFTEIVNRYLKLIYNFTYRLVGNQREAEDLTQEVFLKVWKNIEKFDVNKNFKTWIFSIAKNTSIDYLRKRKDIPMSFFDNDDGGNVIEDNLIDIESKPDEIFSLAHDRKQIETAMKELVLIQKEIVILKYVNEMSLSEIAEIVDMPVNTVKSYHRRALLKLKNLLSAPIL